MTSPKRVIELSRAAFLVQYDMRMKTRERDEDDLHLIDGVSSVNEATVEVISEVQTSFHSALQWYDRGLRRHVLAVMEDECMDLEFKVGLGPNCFVEHFCCFQSWMYQ